MSSIVDRVIASKLPLGQVVVIGSGLLDVLKLRKSNDVDLVVSPELFKQLVESPEYKKIHKGDELCLILDDYEIWSDWGEGADFAFLKSNGHVIDDITFVNKDFLISKKMARGTEKDIKDVKLLKEVNI